MRGFSPDERIGNYRVERALGTAHGASLYQVAHLVLPRRAVIKVNQASNGSLFAVQLLREACLVEALRHPGMPQIFDSGKLPDGRPWFAFEHIDGMSLVERIVAGTLPAFEVASMMQHVGAILRHAHRRGVVHRAIRPDTIVLAEQWRFPVALPDWSEARTHDASARIPHVPAPGTRAYLAPELARGDDGDDRADVYGLGVTAYHALTGTLPRARGKDEPRPALLTDETPALPVHERCPDAPRSLASLIDQMLASDRFDRPSSTEVCDALAAIVEELAPPAAPDPATTLRIRRPRWTPPYTDVRLVPDAPSTVPAPRKPRS